MAESENRRLHAEYIARQKAREAAAHAASPIPDGVTDAVDFSGQTSAALPLATTDFGDVVPAPAPTEPRTEEPTQQGFSMPLGDTYPRSATIQQPSAQNLSEALAQGLPTRLPLPEARSPLAPQPGIPEAAREAFRNMTFEDRFAYRRENYLRDDSTPEDKRKFKEIWNDPRTKLMLDEEFGSKAEIDRLRSQNNLSIQKEEKIYNEKVRSHKQSVKGITGGYAGIGAIMNNTVTTPTPHRELLDLRTADRFLSYAEYTYGIQSEIEREMANVDKGNTYPVDRNGYTWHGARGRNEGNASAYKRLWHGLKPKTKENVLTLGWMETADLHRMNQINAKAARGEKLTDSEKAVAQAFLISLNAEAKLQFLGGATTAEKFGQFIGENVPFLIEMAWSGGLGSVAGGAVRGLARKGIVKGIQMAGKSGAKGIVGAALKNGAGRYVAKQGANIAGSLVGGAAMAPLSQITYRNIENRKLNQYDVGLDAEGNYTAELARPVSTGEIVAKSIGGAVADLGSELWGGWAGIGRIFPRWMRKTKVGEALAPLRKFTQTPSGRRFDNYVGDVFKWNSSPMELLEEEFSNALEPILTGETERLKENFSPEAQFDTILGVIAMSAAMGAVRTPLVVFDHARHARTGAKLRSQINDPTLRESLQQIMASGTRQEQAQKLGQIDWSGASTHDRAAAMDYVAHRVEGRVTQEMQEAMREQAATQEAVERFEQRKNRDTGNLETVTDPEGNSYYLAGGTLEAGSNDTADGTVFVIDPSTGEVSQQSVEELQRGETTTPEQYDASFRQQLETISEAKAEAAAVEEIVEEARATGEDPTPRVAAYRGINLNALPGQTVTLADGSQAYVAGVSPNPGSGLVEIDAVPVDPTTSQLLTDERGEEAHTQLDVRDIVAPSRQEQTQAAEQPNQTAIQQEQQETTGTPKEELKKEDVSGGSSDIGPEPANGLQNGTAPLQNVPQTRESLPVNGSEMHLTESHERLPDLLPTQPDNGNSQNKSTNSATEIRDENGHSFVLASDGSTAFGYIAKETGLSPAPIRLSTGEIINNATKQGYGLVHIEARHGEQIRQAGFRSVEDFVETVAQHYDQIKEGKKRKDGTDTYLLQVEDAHNNTLYVELSKDRSYWNINSAGVFKKSYARGNKMVYSRHTTTNQTAESDEASQTATQRGAIAASRMNAPTIYKATTSVPNVQESSQEIPRKKDGTPETQPVAEQPTSENSQSTLTGTPDDTTTQAQNRISSANLEPEIDENGLPFVTASNGSIDFGQIAEETGLTPAPIRLSTGENRIGPDGKNHGYGLAHIEAGHGDQIRNAGYDSVEQFVELVGKQYTDIREGAKIGENQTYLLELPDNHNNTLFVQLSKDGAYWNVNSAGIFKKRYSRRKPEVYSVPAVGESIDTDASEVHSGHSTGVTAPAGNSPKTSLLKDTTSEPNAQEIPRKKDGTPDYERIEDPTAVASALHEEFGTEAAEVARESLDEAREALEQAGNIRKAIDRRRARLKAQNEVAKWEEVCDALAPTRETEATEQTTTPTTETPVEASPDPVREAATPTEKLRVVGEIVSELNRTSGASAYVFNDVSELPEGLRIQLEEGFERDGITWRRESYICAPQMQDMEQTRRTYIHEVGGHQNVEHAILKMADRTALWEAIVDDIGLDGLRAWGISELTEEITAYEAGEMEKRQLGREALAYATELNADLPYFMRKKPLSLTVDLNQRITPETLRAILETANRYDDQRPRIEITNPGREGLLQNIDGVTRPAGGRIRAGNNSRPENTDNHISGNESTDPRGGNASRPGFSTSRENDSRAVPGQDDTRVDRAEPGALPAGETVAERAEGSESDDIRYRRPQQTETEQNTLVAIHNTTGEQLKKSFSLGGFPMPSIAITQAELGHTEFGEISLLFDKNTINPADRRNRVYGGDAWTPTFPKLGVKIDSQALETASAKIRSLLGEELYAKYNVATELNPYNVEAELDRNDGDVLAAFARDDWMKHAYLKSQSKESTGGLEDLYDQVPTGDKPYREWVASIFAGLAEKIGIRNDKDLFTPIGNRRKWETLHDEVTLDNVVKAMKKQAAKGGESIFGGNIFGSAQSEYKSLAAIREAAKKRLREMTEDESSRVRNDITDRLSGIDIPTQDKSFGAAIDMVANITEAVKHSRTAKGIYVYLHALYPDMTMEVAEEIADIVKDIQNMGTRYFEAKPYRAIGFEEIRLAVVPSDTDTELVRQLERRRIPVRVYERGNEQQRRELVADATAELDIRFRQKEVDRLSPEQINERFNAELRQQIDGTLPTGHVYRLGRPGNALLSAGIPDLPIELSATRLAEKANPEYTNNHPFALEEVADLPRALAEPIAVFDSKTQPGSRVILTELQHDGNNFVAILRVQKKGPGWTEIEINDIRSLYPKDRVGGIIEWINNGLLRWVDKEKTAEFLLVQGPNYLGNGKNTGGSTPKNVVLTQGPNYLAGENDRAISSATNILKNFTNPTLREGEKASAAQTLADELGVPVRVVRSADEIIDSERDARRKRGSTGWHDRSSGEIAVVLPNCADAAEVQRTILHEVVGHYGLPQLLGRERADELYRRVFDAVRDTRRGRELLAEHGSETVAGDEYLAEMAEGNVSPGVFRRMLAAVREFFREVLGIDLKLTDADMRYLLWRSRHNLERARTVGEAMETIEQDIRLRAQTAHESARERKAERLDKLRRSEPIRISGENSEPNRKEIKAWLKENLRGDYINIDTGETITLSNVGINEVTSHGMTHPEHLRSLVAIPEMLERSVFIDELSNVKGNEKYTAYRYYVCGLQIDGTDYTAKIVVGVKDGKRYYDHRLTQIEKGALIDNLNRLSNSVAENQDSPLSEIKDKRLVSVLQAEPLAYQQQKAAKSAPKTVMEHLDRLADETTETTEADETRFRKKREPKPDDPIRTTKENLATRMGRKLQDAHIPVRQLQDYVRKHGGTTDIDTDVYSALNRAFGRQTERMRRTDEKFRRIEKRMNEIHRKWGFKYKATEEYLAAKSSQERHAWGIAAYAETTEAPWNRLHVEETIARFESVVPKEKIEALWRDIREITQHQLDVLKNCDLITVQTYRDIQARGWQYYLPLQGLDFEFEDLADPHKLFDDALTTGRGTGAGALLRQARGRTTKPSDVLATLQRNVHLTIMAGEQNLAKQFLLRLAEQNPQLQGDTRTGKGIFEIEEQWFVRRDDSRMTEAERERGEIYEKTLRRPPQEEVERSEAARREMRQAEQELRAVEKELRSIDPLDGDNDRLAELQDRRIELERRMDEAFDRITVLRTPPPKHAYTGLSKSEEARFEVPVYRHGVRTVVRLSDANAARAVNGDFESLLGGASEAISRWIGRATRTMAGLNTSWNPEFMLKNKVRDSAWALFYNWLDKEGSARGYLRNQGPAHAAIYRYHTNGARPLTMNERAGYDLYSAEGRQQAVERYGAARVRDSLYDDFLMEGGLTGYAYLQDLDHYSRKLKKRARRAGNSILQAFNAAATGFDLLNDLSEVSTRFATFLAQVERGSDVRSAVNYARDVTINFNRRGEWGRDLNALYMFYNASLQGVANLYQLGRRNKTRMGFAMAAVAGLGYGLSFLLNLWLSAMADEAGDDDEWRVSDYRRFTNICLPGWLIGSTERAVTIPLPQELRPAWVLGTVLADVTQGRLRADEGWGTAAAIFNSVADAAGESFLPVEFDSKHPLKTFVPSVFKPLYEISVNANFMGRKIYREAYPGQTIPESQLGMRNTFIAYKTSCEWLNELGGGSTTVPAGMDATGEINQWLNLLDVNPSKAEHLLSSYTGGVGRLIGRTWRCIAEPGDERRASDIPFINAFMADVEKQENPNTRYYDTKEKLEMLNEVYRRSEREGSFPAYYRSAEEAQAARARDRHWLLELRKTDRQLKKLTQERNETEQGSPEYQALTREMNRLRTDFLTRYDHGSPESPAPEAETTTND